MELRALLFDVDGTLAETEEIHRHAFNAAFAEMGLAWHWDRERYRALLKVSGGKERIRHFLSQYHPDVLELGDADGLIAALHRIKTRRYTEAVAAGGVSLRPGVARLINEAKADGLRLAIVTTTSRANVDALLAAAFGAGWESVFDSICCAEDAPVKKPAPDAYQWTLEKLGLAGAECLALEDTANGVQAARAAGVPVLVTESLYSRGEDFTGSLAVLSDLGEPGRPFRVLAGPAIVEGRGDPGLLRRLHSGAHREP